MPDEQKPAESVAPIALSSEATPAENGQESPVPGSFSFDGVDKPNLDPRNFLGFPIFDAVPTHEDLEGKLVAMDDGTTRRLYIFLSGAWRAIPAGFLGAYGEIYTASQKTLTLTNAGQVYNVGDGSGVGTNGIFGGGVTVDQGNWSITPIAGNFRVSLSLSFSSDRTCKLDFYANQGGDLTNIHAEHTVTATGVIYTVAISGLAALTTGALTPKAVTDTAGTVLTFERINLHITSV